MQGVCARQNPLLLDPRRRRGCMYICPLAFNLSFPGFSVVYRRLPPAIFAARYSFSRTLSSLSPGKILQGAHWDYRVVGIVKGDDTHTSRVFKAEVFTHENTSNAVKVPRWALIKVASPEDATAVLNMDRELKPYRLPGVGSSESFRKLYDVIDNTTLALEWLDTTLAEVEYKPNIHVYSLIMSVLREAVTSCLVLEQHNHVNTDYKPANILLSGEGSDCIVAKVGDLGLVVPVGHLINAQLYAMRAPEVFLGHACTEPSQIWKIAAMLLCWIKPGILGVWDCLHPLINEAWCMAKIKQLFPHWPTPGEDSTHVLRTAVKSARSLITKVPELQARLPLEEETKKVEMPRQLRDLLRFMLVPDLAQRPSASSVLESGEFRAFEKLARI